MASIFRVTTQFLFYSTLFLSCSTASSQKNVTDFSLLNVDGKMVSLKEFPNAKGFIIIFTCNHCPFAKLYPSRINALNARFSILNVPVIAISSTDTVTYEEDCFKRMVEKSKSEHFNFPYLYDGKQVVAKNFGAENTPHAFVVWKENSDWIIKYSGAIDDNGAEPENVKAHYVVDAVNLLLENKLINFKQVSSIGCRIHFRKQG